MWFYLCFLFNENTQLRNYVFSTLVEYLQSFALICYRKSATDMLNLCVRHRPDQNWNRTSVGEQLTLVQAFRVISCLERCFQINNDIMVCFDCRQVTVIIKLPCGNISSCWSCGSSMWPGAKILAGTGPDLVLEFAAAAQGPWTCGPAQGYVGIQPHHCDSVLFQSQLHQTCDHLL